jgi:hypothetical protein
MTSDRNGNAMAHRLNGTSPFRQRSDGQPDRNHAATISMVIPLVVALATTIIEQFHVLGGMTLQVFWFLCLFACGVGFAAGIVGLVNKKLRSLKPSLFIRGCALFLNGIFVLSFLLRTSGWR